MQSPNSTNQCNKLPQPLVARATHSETGTKTPSNSPTSTANTNISVCGNDNDDDEAGTVEDYEAEFRRIVAGYFSVLERCGYDEFYEGVSRMNIKDVRQQYTVEAYKNAVDNGRPETFFLLTQRLNLPEKISPVNHEFSHRLEEKREESIANVMRTNIRTEVILSSGNMLDNINRQDVFTRGFIFGERLVDVIEESAREKVPPDVFCGHEAEAEELYRQEMSQLRACVSPENEYTLFVCQMSPLTNLDFDACTAEVFVTVSARTATVKYVTLGCHCTDSTRLDRWLRSSGYYKKMKHHACYSPAELVRMEFMPLRCHATTAAEIIDVTAEAAKTDVKNNIPLWSLQLSDKAGVLAYIPKDPKKIPKQGVYNKSSLNNLLFFTKRGLPRRYPFDEAWGIGGPERFVPSRLALSPVVCSNVNSPMAHFEANVENWRKKIVGFLGVPKSITSSAISAPSREFMKIVAWLRNFRPVHQCSLETADSITSLGWVCSLSTLAGLWSTPTDIARIVWKDPSAKQIIQDFIGKSEDIPKIEAINKYVTMLCRVTCAERTPAIVKKKKKAHIQTHTHTHTHKSAFIIRHHFTVNTCAHTFTCLLAYVKTNN